jgi:hypothetical protein
MVDSMSGRVKCRKSLAGLFEHVKYSNGGICLIETLKNTILIK